MPLKSPRYSMRSAINGMTYQELEAFTGPKDQMDRKIDWCAGRMAVLREYQIREVLRGQDATPTEELKMQRQFTVELRVDFADQDKLPEIKQVLQQCARHAYATAQLISDNPKTTQVAIFSDDFFSGHEEIKLLDDVIQQGLDSIGETSGSESLSSELVGAMNGRV